MKKPEYYPEFLEVMKILLTRFYIKGETCLVAEQEGEIVAVAILQQHDFTIFFYLLNGVIKLFHYISLQNLLKYLNLVERSEKHLKKSENFDWYLKMIAVNSSSKGRGIGSSFLKECVEPYVKSRDCKHLGLITNTEKNVSFYEKNDYVLQDYMELEYGTKSIGNWTFLKTIDKALVRKFIKKLSY